jgi:hypothetical protein
MIGTGWPGLRFFTPVHAVVPFFERMMKRVAIVWVVMLVPESAKDKTGKNAGKGRGIYCRTEKREKSR